MNTTSKIFGEPAVSAALMEPLSPLPVFNCPGSRNHVFCPSGRIFDMSWLTGDAHDAARHAGFVYDFSI